MVGLRPSGDLDVQTLALLDRCAPQLKVVLVTNATSRLHDDLRALGIAALANTLVKFLLVAMLGRGPLRLRLAVATGVLFLAWLLLSW